MISMKNALPQIQGHVFVNPVDQNAFMGMLCYKNASLTRQAARDEHNLSWEEFGDILENTESAENIFINFPLTEITPFAQGQLRFVIHNDEMIQVCYS